MRTRLILGSVLLLVLAGCSSSPSPLPSPAASAPATSDVATRALQDIERYWTVTYPTLTGGTAFTPVRGGCHPYTQTDPPPPWDAEKLIPQLQNDFGQLLVGVVLAHEEQHADCGHSTAFSGITPAQLDSTVAGVLRLRDQPGTSVMTDGAHGNAFDRIRALQDGVQEGATKCAAYSADNPPVTEVLSTVRSLVPCFTRTPATTPSACCWGTCTPGPPSIVAENRRRTRQVSSPWTALPDRGRAARSHP